MYALLTSTGVVASSEVGDKTRVLALLLASQTSADRAPHFRGDRAEPHRGGVILLDPRLRRSVQRQHAVGATRNGLFFGDRHRDAGDLDVDRAEMVAAGEIECLPIVAAKGNVGGGGSSVHDAAELFAV